MLKLVAPGRSQLLPPVKRYWGFFYKPGAGVKVDGDARKGGHGPGC